MKFIVTEYNRCVLMEIFGRVDSYTSPQIKDALNSLIADNHTNFVIDMKNAIYLSSSGILTFVSLQKQLTGRSMGKIVFSTVSNLIFSSFELSGFDQLFEFFEDASVAVRSF